MQMIPVSFDSDDERSHSSSGSVGSENQNQPIPTNQNNRNRGGGNVVFYTSDDDNMSVGRSSKKQQQQQLGRSNPLARRGLNNYSDDADNDHSLYTDNIYTSSTSNRHGHDDIMDLRALDEYVQRTILQQRQQRRKEMWGKFLLVFGFLAFATTLMFSSLFWERNGGNRDPSATTSDDTTKLSDETISAAFIESDKKSSSNNNVRTKPRSPPTVPVPVPVPVPSFVPDPTYQLSSCESNLNHGRSFPEILYETNALGEERKKCRPEVPNCDWLNPIIPAVRKTDNIAIAAEWEGAFQFNVHHIMESISTDTDMLPHGQPTSVQTQTNANATTTTIADATRHKDIDVVLIGDSIVEHWEGKDMGIVEPTLQREHEVFEHLFTRHGGGQIDGMAHGINKDRCANLLYRLENGEMPEPFNPKVWWVLVGREDWHLGVDNDAIVGGILTIVKTIQRTHPETQIVINSILPRGNEQQLGNPKFNALHTINNKLECFVHTENDKTLLEGNGDPKLVFFNATSIFLYEEPDEGYFVNTALLPDYVHLSAQGETIWGRKIVEMVLALTSDKHGLH